MRGSTVACALALLTAACNELPTSPLDNLVPLAACARGFAGAHPCRDIDLLARLSPQDLGMDLDPVAGYQGELSDLWGWTDPETGTEWALVGHTTGTAFVSLADPTNPVLAGVLPLTAGAHPSGWRDIKVHRDHAFVVSDLAGAHGVQVLDLRQLRDVDDPPATFRETALYDGVASAHNIAINEATGFAYVVGANGGGETCGGGLHMIDVRTPASPAFAGCFSDPSTGVQQTGYTHDALCVVYRGPDVEHAGREVCFGSNEDALSIADVTDKGSPFEVSVSRYPNAAYAHQAWLDEGHEYLYLNDELDEFELLSPTRTLVWDVRDLDDPLVVGEHVGSTAASDHNLFVHGTLMYQTNYQAGLRILDIRNPAAPIEVAFFDTEPDGEDQAGFDGAWSSYPFFGSGAIPVASTRGGLFVLRHSR